MGKRQFMANLSSLGKKGQSRLRSASVGVAGLGGVGGIAFELLVRSGVGRIKIGDSGFFEESNANRQSLWTRENDGKKKEKAAEEFASQVNPGCEIIRYGRITRRNSPSFASGCSSVIDATDSKESRMAVYFGCKKASVPYVFASALGVRGMLSVFSRTDFNKEFGLGARGAEFLSCDHSLGPVANAIGCLAAQQSINIAMGKQAIEFPRVLSIDAFSGSQLSVHRF